MAEAIKMGGGAGKIKNTTVIKPLAYEENVEANTLIELFQSKVVDENTNNMLVTNSEDLIFTVSLSDNKDFILYAVNNEAYGMIVSYTDTGIVKSTPVDLGKYTSSGSSQQVFTLACCASDENHIYLIQNKNESQSYETTYYRTYITEININNMVITVGASTKINETTTYNDGTVPYTINGKRNNTYCNLTKINSNRLMFSYWASGASTVCYFNVMIISLVNGHISTIGTRVNKRKDTNSYISWLTLNPLNLTNNIYILPYYSASAYGANLMTLLYLQKITINNLTVTFGNEDTWKPFISGITTSDKLYLSLDIPDDYTFNIVKISTNKLLLLASSQGTISNNKFSGGIYAVIFDYTGASLVTHINNFIDIIYPNISENNDYKVAAIFITETVSYCVVNNSVVPNVSVIISFKISENNTIKEVRRSSLLNDNNVMVPRVYMTNLYNNKIRGYFKASLDAYSGIPVTSFNIDFFVKQAKISTKCDGLLKTKATLTSRGKCELLTDNKEV